MVVRTLRLDPALASLVARSRERAAEAGEMVPARIGPFESPLPFDAQRIVRGSLDDGGYAAAVVAEEPDLANQ